MKNKKLLFGIFLAFLFLASFSLTYAYFSVGVSGNDQAKSITTNTGTLEITYNGGQEIKVEDIYPGWSSTKTFTVTNTGSLNTYYSINWDDLTNTISNNELVMSLSCTGTDCRTINEKPVGNVNGPFTSGILLKSGTTHTYTLTLTFIETGSDQNYNQGKEFSGKITIEGDIGFVSVYGKLIDASNNPIMNAMVTIHSNPQTTTTDENGNFMFNNVEVDNHTISASLSGTEILNDSLVIINGDINSIDGTTITKKVRNNELKIKIKLASNERIESIEEIHYTLSPNWAEILNITKTDIKAIAVEKTLSSPLTYTYDGVTYNRQQNGVDVSDENNGTVLASTYSDETSEVIVMINSIGKTSLPQDSSYLFSNADNYNVSLNEKIIQVREPNTSKKDSIDTTLFSTNQNTTKLNMDFNNINAPKITSVLASMSSDSYFLNLEYLQAENFNTSQVTDMYRMFDSAGFNAIRFVLDLSNWDTSQVIDMYRMFDHAGTYATTFNLDLSNLDTSQVTDMSNMFSNAGRSATTFDIRGLSNLDTSKVTYMSNMFNSAGGEATTFNIGNLSDWNTSQVTDMSNMFFDAGGETTTFNIGNLSDWNTSQVTDMNYMFYRAGYQATTFNIGNLSDWNTSQVTNMDSMFSGAGYQATTFNIGNLSDWNTSQVTDMSYMFSDAGREATTWNIGNLSDWNTSQVTDMSYMFSDAGRSATTWNIGNLSDWDTSQVTTMESMFDFSGQNATTWNIGDISDWNTSQVKVMSRMFQSVGHNATALNLDLSGWNTSQVINIDWMFSSAGGEATELNIDLSGWDISQIPKLWYTFYDTGYNATTSTLNIKGFNLSSSNTTLSRYNNLFYCMKSNARIIVESNESKNWILGLSSSDRPSSWNSNNIIVDNAVPTNNRVSISNGTSQIRTLTLESTGANRMCISSTSNVASNCTHWEGYKTTKEYAFPNTTGNHTIYVFYRMGTGDISNAVSATTTVSSIIPAYEIFDNNEYDSAFTITPGATYPWTAKNNRFESTNTRVENTTSSSTISFTPDANKTLSFDYGVSCSYYGKLLITLTGSDSSSITIANNISSIQDLTYTGNVLSGVTYTLTISYIKASINGDGNYKDIAYIDNLKIQ